MESISPKVTFTAPGVRWLHFAAILAVCWTMLWLGSGAERWRSGYSFTGQPQDYYNLLVEGFLEGHLYMKATPHPDLLSSDPAIRHAAPSLLDAAFYQGHYYLYFGVTPAVLTFLPYRWLTGYALSPNLVTLAFTFLGFGFALATVRAAARDHLGPLGPAMAAGLPLFLGFATVTPSLLVRSMFYEVPIAAGYACCMAGVWWLYRAVQGHGVGWIQIALASLAFGLAVGCRPDHALALPLVAGAAWWVGRREGGRRTILPLGLAAILPAAVIGAGLAAYNYFRFGDPLEFGFKYGQNAFLTTGEKLTSPGFVGSNLKWYYLSPPSFSPYFPFVFPVNGSFRPSGYHGHEAVHGQLVVFVMLMFVGISALLVWRKIKPGRLGLVLAGLGWMFVTTFGFMVLLGIRANRYMVDFQPPLVLGLGLLASAIAARGMPFKLWRGAWLALSCAAAGFNILAALQQYDQFRDARPRDFARLAHIGDLPSAWAMRAGWKDFGPVKFKVVFPSVKTATIEPLLTLGVPEYNDTINVVQHPDHRIEFFADHNGYGGPHSDFIPIIPDREYEVTVDMGALYPPPSHPFFSSYNPETVNLLKTRVRVTLDHVAVIDARMASYDAPPGTLQLGRNTITYTLYKTSFSGRIDALERLPITSELHHARIHEGLWRLRSELPLQLPNSRHPVLGFGISGHGNLLLLNVLADHRIQFAWDEWGFSMTSSAPIDCAPGVEHVLEIFVGPLAARHAWPDEWSISPAELEKAGQLVRVWLDGRPVWTTPVAHHLASFTDDVQVGSNTQGFSSAPANFSGRLQIEPMTLEAQREFLRRNLPVDSTDKR